MNMDVNLCRLPDLTKYVSKFLVPLAVIMWHPHPADSDGIRSKQRKGQPDSKKNTVLRKITLFGVMNQCTYQMQIVRNEYHILSPPPAHIHIMIQNDIKCLTSNR